MHNGRRGQNIFKMNEEKLIEAVRDFPCLWQVSSRCYRDAKAKENAWKKVSSQVNIYIYHIKCIIAGL